MIQSGDLQNRETGPAPKGSEKVTRDIAGMKSTIKPDELEARLAQARALAPPTGPEAHCGHCWGSGRDAAIRVLEGRDGPAAGV